MVSIISILLSLPNLFRRKRKISVRRMPPRKVLRAHLLGLSWGFFSVLSLILLSGLLKTPLDLSGQPLSFFFYLSLFVLVFGLGNLIGGLFVIVVVILALSIDPGGESIRQVFHLMTIWYSWGYLSGAIFATLYNDLVFLNVLVFHKDAVKIVFNYMYDKEKPCNIIKSPIESEVTAPILDEDRKLYDYQFKKDSRDNKTRGKVEPPENPYTIAFVANPLVFQMPDDPENPDYGERNNYKVDPIMWSVDLFLRAVDWALASLETDEVVGRPEIWSRIRVIAIFDRRLASPQEKLKNTKFENEIFGMVQPYPAALKIDGKLTDNLLATLDQMPARYKMMLEASGLTNDGPEKELDKYYEQTDVIFALSATPYYTRCTANYSDWEHDEQDIIDPAPLRDGEDFKFETDPLDNKTGEIDSHTCDSDSPNHHHGSFVCRHEYYTHNPGRIALNIFGAKTKTFIHEFGHAMSAAFRGAIVDEYADRFEVETTGGGNNTADVPRFYANRIERVKRNDGKVVLVHKPFADYNQTRFHSDLDHPSAEENWLGYFPERKSPGITCTMDRTYGRYAFDKLLSNFIYDRLITKINRP